MKYVVLVLFLALFTVPGCSHYLPVQYSRQVQVFGLQLAEQRDIKELNGETGVDEPCLHGYERRFDRQGVTISYRHNGSIRRILTSNPLTGAFGISPGMSVVQAADHAQKGGFTKKDKYTYQNDTITIKLLTDENDRLFALALELDR